MVKFKKFMGSSIAYIGLVVTFILIIQQITIDFKMLRDIYRYDIVSSQQVGKIIDIVEHQVDVDDSVEFEYFVDASSIYIETKNGFNETITLIKELRREEAQGLSVNGSYTFEKDETVSLAKSSKKDLLKDQMIHVFITPLILVIPVVMMIVLHKIKYNYKRTILNIQTFLILTSLAYGLYVFIVYIARSILERQLY